jgi:hypothetical protein
VRNRTGRMLGPERGSWPIIVRDRRTRTGRPRPRDDLVT